MINRNQAAEIRTCERIKFDQALYILTMYQKKLRIPFNIDPEQPIDAQKQYEQRILRSWNKKWQNDLTKPILNCVTSLHPRVLYDSFNQKLSNINAFQYNRIMERFIKRLKVQHEDESNFKIVQQHIDEVQVPEHKKGKIYIMESLMHFVNTIKSMTESMKKSISSKEDKFENLQDNSYCYETVSILERILQIVNSFEEQVENNVQLMQFIYSVMKVFDDIKESEYGSTLISAQPNVKDFTFLVHPMLIPIYSNLRREKDQVRRKHEQKEENKGLTDKSTKILENSHLNNQPFRQFFSLSTSSLPKTVFLNLDGYESQYNLEFARCLRKNLMYISFPKEDAHSKNDDNSVFQKRFFKKLMYNYEKNILRSYQKASSSTMGASEMMEDQLQQQISQKYSLLNDAQEYFNNIQHYLYEFQKGYEDVNKNAYIFPLRLHSFAQNFNAFKEQNDGILEIYESDVVMQIFRSFLVNQIREFNPTYIIMSYSGRLRISDQHFVQIMQQLTKLSHYKVIMFPNMTSSFYSSSILNHDINTKNINYMKQRSLTNYQKNQQMQIQQQQANRAQLEYCLFNKLARFLKVSSGNHSLTKSYEESGTLSKFKNLTVLRKINRLMGILGQQYENIQRMRFKNQEIEFIPKLYEKDYFKIKKAFSKLVPRYYEDLYDVIEAMMAVLEQYEEDSQMVLKTLKEFNISIQGIRQNIQLRELIDQMKQKIVIRDMATEQKRNKMLFESILKNFRIEREKHFMEICQQKYEDTVLLYFRLIDCKDLYEQSEQNKINLRGLIDVSFMNPNKQARQTLQIFESTQILYETNQRHDHGAIPILIMNHLPLDRKFVPKFDNYCAFLNRKTVQEYANVPKNQKISELRRQRRVFPIKFYDLEGEEIVQHRFQFRVQWNYLETQRYMVLYWPSMFNMIEAISCRIRGKLYKAPILNQFFIGQRKSTDNIVKFYMAGLPNDISPRSGCTAYTVNNQIYIFGGFYDKSKNYLQLQKDITRVNFEHYNHQNQRKLQVINQKDNLFPIIRGDDPDDFDKNGAKRNSYARARQEYQFYDIEEIALNYQVEQGIKTVLMIGGYGQNFLHPYSMLTYYFYILKFRRNDNMLISIQKRYIYNNTVPINIKESSKNMGIIKTNMRTRNNNEKKLSGHPQLTELDSYAKFRVVYRLNQASNEFLYKFQFIFSEKDIKIHKQELRKINDEKFETGEVSNVRMEKIQGVNNKFIAENAGSKQIVNLRLQLETDFNENYQILTNDSVKYLSIVNGNYICAIIQHPFYTNGRSLVVQYKQKSIQSNYEHNSYINLKPITDKNIQGDLSLHILMANNKNFVYVLHGHRIFESELLHEYQIVTYRRDNSKIVNQIKSKQQIFPSQMKLRCCYSAFFHLVSNSRNQIVCQSFVGLEQSNVIYFVCEKFEPMDSTNLRWTLTEKPNSYLFCVKTLNNSIRLDRTSFLEYYRELQTSKTIIVLSYNKKKYLAIIEVSTQKQQGQQIPVLLEQTNEAQIRKLQQLQAEKAIILLKKPDNYIDKGYINL